MLFIDKPLPEERCTIVRNVGEELLFMPLHKTWSFEEIAHTNVGVMRFEVYSEDQRQNCEFYVADARDVPIWSSDRITADTERDQEEVDWTLAD